MHRRFAWLWFIAGSSVACVPDWARPIQDAGADAGESEGDDDSGEGLDVAAGDAAQPALDATGAVSGEPGERAADTGLIDAAAEPGTTVAATKASFFEKAAAGTSPRAPRGHTRAT